MMPKSWIAILSIGWWSGLGLWGYWQIVTSELHAQILATLLRGVQVTVFVTLVGFALASALGLGIALMSLSGSLVLRQVARFYTEIVRGIPIIVLLLYVAFVLAPGLVAFRNLVLEPLGFDPIRTREFSLLWRAIIALMIGYSAFIAEVFRAGLLLTGSTGQWSS